MLSFEARADSRQERYRDLVYGTAELVSRNVPPAELLTHVCELGKRFFSAASVSIALRSFDSRADGAVLTRSAFRDDLDERAVEVLRTGQSTRSDDGSVMHVPMRFGSEVQGVVCVCADPAMRYDDVDASLLEKWAMLLAVRFQEIQLSEANARLEVLAGIDGLTGIHNRRAFGDMLTHAWERARQSATAVSVAMIDVDFFKAYNDNYGHVAGDVCLKQIAQTISQALRVGDVLGRYGGEEFDVLIEGASRDVAIRVAERLRESIFALGVPHLGARLGRVTASVGVADIVPTAAMEPTELLQRADEALYSAKAQGRNRVVAGSYVSGSSVALPRYDVRNNLPTPVSSFCGRQEDVAAVHARLAESRLVTLVGFGGVGKTRLALEIAHELVGTFRDGVWFVDLAGTTDGDVVPGLVAAALEIRDPAASCSDAELVERCRHKQLLLILDNCEHLKKQCAAFAGLLLRATHDVHILATSREPLGIAEELVAPLAPLALPAEAPATAEAALQYPAVRLFVDRAKAVTSFTLSDAGVPAVIDICRRVDGIALAIELAAARLKMLTVEQLRGKLDRRFSVLSRKGSNVAQRQQTLRALIDWSFDLLLEEERRLFRRLGFFAGSFTYEAAAAICGDDDAEGIVLDTLQALVDKSLLIVETRRDGQYTFRFFESIRSYAYERLESAGETRMIAARHWKYYRDAAAAAEAARTTGDWLAALRPLEYAVDEIRASLEWAIGREEDLQAGAEFAAMLPDFWQLCYAPREGRVWLNCALKRGDHLYPPALRARVRLALLDMMPTHGDAHLALALASEALELLKDAGDERLSAEALGFLGKAKFAFGDLDAAWACVQEAQLANERVGNLLAYGSALNYLGAISSLRDEPEPAGQYYAQCVKVYQRINRERRAVAPLGNMADDAFEAGAHDEAIALAKRALAIAERNKDRPTTAWLLANLGTYFVALGDLDSGSSFLRDALPMTLEVEDEWLLANCCDCFARIAFERGDPETAAHLLGYAEQRLVTLGQPRQPAEQKVIATFMERLRDVLGSEPLGRALAYGRAMSRDAMLAEIETPPPLRLMPSGAA